MPGVTTPIPEMPEAIADLLRNAGEKHAPWVENLFLQGTYAIDLQQELELEGRGVTLTQGTYPVDADGNIAETLVRISTATGEEADPGMFTVEYEEDVFLDVKLVPIVSEGKPVTFMEVWANLAFLKAETQADAKIIHDYFFSPVQEAIKPIKQVQSISKFAQALPALERGVETPIEVSKGVEKRVQIDFNPKELERLNIRTNTPISRELIDVNLTIASMWREGNTSFTVEQVWKNLTGAPDNARPSEKQRAEVERLIDLSRLVLGTIDERELSKWGELELDGEPIEAIRHEQYLLPCNKTTIRTVNGRLLEGYTIIDAPLIYREAAIHSKRIKGKRNHGAQMIEFPTSWLEVPGVQNTVRNATIQRYLIRRIKSTGLSKRIKYSTLYDQLEGFDRTDKRERRKVNDIVIKCFEFWKSRKVVKDYSEYMEKRTRAGVEFTV